MPDEMDDEAIAKSTAWCALCEPHESMPLDVLAGHMRAVHGLDLADELETWPDGTPVIVDTTLEPDDFTRS